MKKKLLQRIALGLPVGILLGYLITLLISLCLGEGTYVACVPALTEQMGGELNAVLFQALLCAILGAGCAASSLIWELDRWSIARQSGTYFLCLALLMLPIAWLAHWMEHSLSGFLGYFALFFGIFVITWLAQYGAIRAHIRKINQQLEKGQE